MAGKVIAMHSIPLFHAMGLIGTGYSVGKIWHNTCGFLTCFQCKACLRIHNGCIQAAVSCNCAKSIKYYQRSDLRWLRLHLLFSNFPRGTLFHGQSLASTDLNCLRLGHAMPNM